jgi:hypothetical protein
LSMAAGIAPRLRAHVSRIDQYMAEAAMQRARESQVYHNLPRENWVTPAPTTRVKIATIPFVPIPLEEIMS